MDESSFYVGDAIRINLDGQAAVILVQRIWTADSNLLPHVCVSGFVLNKAPHGISQESEIIRQISLQNAFVSCGAYVTIPISACRSIDAIDRAPVCMILQQQ